MQQHYKHFYEERIKAKQNGDKNKSESYKIILNGSFGKFGSPFSCLPIPFRLLGGRDAHPTRDAARASVEHFASETWHSRMGRAEN